MRLKDLIEALPDVTLVAGDPATEITGVTHDSRTAGPGTIFFALPGLRHDGHQFVAGAVAAGAAGVCVSQPVAAPLPPGLVVLRASDTRRTLAVAAAALHGHPAQQLKLVGVTGTKGKTTTTHLVRAVFEAAGHRTGLVGTINNIVGGQSEPVKHTTPEAPLLQSTFARMVAAGDTHAVMEVSSHALALHRVGATPFDIAVLTNIGHDHLDFHADLDDYIAAKCSLFAGLAPGPAGQGKPSPAAIINDDETYAGRFRLATPPGVSILTYGLGAGALVSAERVALHANGADFLLRSPVGAAEVHLALPGRFNVYNSLAAAATGIAAGIDLSVIVAALGGVAGVDGRFERVVAGQSFAVIVDYAHTPESLASVLDTARELTRGRLIVVFGCGGDRDRTRRPTMGRIAAAKADLVFITSDNPRSEEPEKIIDDIVAGLPGDLDPGVWQRNADRAGAIRAALLAARTGDVVLIAGKGHETYQILGETTIHFDDREVAREVLREAGLGEGA
jgi:UDP-N-acetylmuramoyl-L-alanyl-D-glutamate--2,6-diaminopimelate ligase